DQPIVSRSPGCLKKTRHLCPSFRLYKTFSTPLRMRQERGLQAASPSELADRRGICQGPLDCPTRKRRKRCAPLACATPTLNKVRSAVHYPSRWRGVGQHCGAGVLKGLLTGGVVSNGEQLVDECDALADLIAGPDHRRDCAA